MNKNISILIITLLFTAAVSGQRKPDRERIKTLKIAYITEELQLTSAEAEKFWPIYNAHDTAMEGFRKREMQEIKSKYRAMDEISDKEAEELLNKMLEIEQYKNDEKVGFIQNVSTVLSAKKTLLLIKAERAFTRRLLKRMQERKKRK